MTGWVPSNERRPFSVVVIPDQSGLAEKSMPYGITMSITRLSFEAPGSWLTASEERPPEGGKRSCFGECAVRVRRRTAGSRSAAWRTAPVPRRGVGDDAQQQLLDMI